jgi:hypothetical protein
MPIKAAGESWEHPLALSLAVTPDSPYFALTFCISNVCCNSLWTIFYLAKVMARCSPLSEIAGANVVEAKNLDVAEIPTEVARAVGGGEVPEASDGEGRASSVGGIDDSTDGGASDIENSWMYYFVVSTITLGKIKEMVERGYFADGEARASGAEAVLETDNDEAVIYEDFFLC